MVVGQQSRLPEGHLDPEPLTDASPRRAVLCFGMIEDEKVATLRTVIAESQRLGALAPKSGLDSVASLCEQTMRHARAELARLGASPELELPTDDPKVLRPKRWRK